MGSGGQFSQNQAIALPLTSFGKLFSTGQAIFPPFAAAEYRHNAALSSVYVVQAILNARHLRVVFLYSKLRVEQIRQAFNRLFASFGYLYSGVAFKQSWLYFYLPSGNICYACENSTVIRSIGELGRLLTSTYLTSQRLISVSLQDVYIPQFPGAYQALILEISQVLVDSSSLNRVACALQLALEGALVFKKYRYSKPLTPLSYLPAESAIEAKEIEALLSLGKPAGDICYKSEKLVLLHSSSRRMVALANYSLEISVCAFSFAVCAAYKLALQGYRASISLTLGISDSCEAYIMSNRAYADANAPIGNFQRLQPIAISACAETKLSQICRRLLAALNFYQYPQDVFMKACREHYSAMRRAAGYRVDLQVQYCECSDPVVDYSLSNTDYAQICSYYISQLDGVRICAESVQKEDLALHCRFFEVWDHIACGGLDVSIYAVIQMLEKTAAPL